MWLCGEWERDRDCEWKGGAASAGAGVRLSECGNLICVSWVKAVMCEEKTCFELLSGLRLEW